jgi:TRAP-type mannitol/chloroaromatic compound transport system permease small subunit
LRAVVVLIERVVGAVGLLAALLLIPLVLATCYEVWSRYVLDAPTAWAYEIGYILTGSHFLLGLAYTLRAGEHIRIDIFSARFNVRTRATLDLITYSVMFALFVWMVWALFGYLLDGYARGERSGQSALNMQVWPFRVVFVLSFGLFALQVLAELLKSLSRLTSRKS